MMDGIIKADGTSRLMRATLPATYEEFRAQCAAGTQPLDVLFNAIGWSQFPTFLNKANLLKDDTAAAFGLGADAVPDDSFAHLGQYAQHWWSVLHGAAQTIYVEHQVEAWSDYASVALTGSDDWSIPYADSVTVDPTTGAITLNNPTTHTATNASDSEKADLAYRVRGKYITNMHSDPDNVYFIPYGTSIEYGGNVWINPSSYAPIYRVTAIQTVIPEGETTYVHSPDRNAYTEGTDADGNVFTYLGIPFDNSIVPVRVATGSYVGTGTYGASNPNSLTFDFVPKLVMIFGAGAAYFWGSTSFDYDDGSRKISCTASVSGTTMSWYHASDAQYQLNISGSVYNYIAIG